MRLFATVEDVAIHYTKSQNLVEVYGKLYVYSNDGTNFSGTSNKNSKFIHLERHIRVSRTVEPDLLKDSHWYVSIANEFKVYVDNKTKSLVKEYIPRGDLYRGSYLKGNISVVKDLDYSDVIKEEF